MNISILLRSLIVCIAIAFSPRTTAQETIVKQLNWQYILSEWADGPLTTADLLDEHLNKVVEDEKKNGKDVVFALDLKHSGLSVYQIPDRIADEMGIAPDLVVLREWMTVGNDELVAFLEGYVVFDDYLLPNPPFSLGDFDLSKIRQIGSFASKRVGGGLSSENYDVKIKFGDNSVFWNIAFAGVDPVGFIPFVESKFNKGTPYVQYAQSDTVHRLKKIESLTNGVSTMVSGLTYVLKASKGYLNLITKLDKKGVTGVSKIPPIAANIEEWIFDPANSIAGLRGAIYAGGGKSFPNSPGFIGELSLGFDPFQLNSLGIGLDNLDIGLPFTADTVYFQRVFGSINDIATPPWYLHADVLFSFGPTSGKIPILDIYPFDLTGYINIKANGYAETVMDGRVLGFPMSEAGLMLDPLNLKFKFYFEDFPQDPMFLHSGSISVAGTSFSSSLSTRVGIPKRVPVIGGYTAAGVGVGIENRDDAKLWDVHAQFGYTIAPRIPEECVSVPVKLTIPTPYTKWNDCCTRVPFVGCVGCNELKVESKTIDTTKEVCTPAIPEISAEFRVGILVGSVGVSPYYDQKGRYDYKRNRFSNLYLTPHKSWENPFYNFELDSEGRIHYFNYNWDQTAKFYYPQTSFAPAQVGNLNPAEIEFQINSDKPVASIVRIHYEGSFENTENLSLFLPNGQELTAEEDNRPHGFAETVTPITSHHNIDNKEIIFIIHRAPVGDYTVSINNAPTIGEFTVEVFQQNHKPVVEYDFVTLLKEPKGEDFVESLQVEMQLRDHDTAPEDIKLNFFIDRNKSGNDGIHIGEQTLSDFENGGSVHLKLEDHKEHRGQFYLYAKVDDGVNAPYHHYFDQSLQLENPHSGPELLDFQLAAIDNGFEIEITPGPGSPDCYYDVIISKEYDLDWTGHTFSIYDAPYRNQVTNLVNGEPYIVSVCKVFNDGSRVMAKDRRRVIPGYIGSRPLFIPTTNIPSVPVGYPYHYQIFHHDGDLLETNPAAKSISSSASYSIIGDNRGAIVGEFGLFSWKPNSDHIGDNHFIVKITPKVIVDGQLELDSSRSTIHEFQILVTPATNLHSVTAHSHRFLSDPVRAVIKGNSYQYTPVISSAETDKYAIRLVEFPEGLQYVKNSGTVFWDTDQSSKSDFVEIELVDPNGTILDSQRWFIDVRSEDGYLNDSIRIHNVTVEQDDSSDTKDITLVWDAPPGDYVIHFTDNLRSDWIAIEDQVLLGKYGNRTGLRIPSSLAQCFFKVVPKNLSNN